MNISAFPLLSQSLPMFRLSQDQLVDGEIFMCSCLKAWFSLATQAQLQAQNTSKKEYCFHYDASKISKFSDPCACALAFIVVKTRLYAVPHHF